MSAIELKSCPKVYTPRNTTARGFPRTRCTSSRACGDLLGMRDFRDATALDRIGIPVYTCWRLRPDESKTFHTGKGISAIQAQRSVTFESIERYSSEFREEWADRLIVGSFNALRRSTTRSTPQTLILSQFSDYGPDKDLHWDPGYDITNDQEILVPAKRSTTPSIATKGFSTAPTQTGSHRATPSRRPSSTPSRRSSNETPGASPSTTVIMAIPCSSRTSPKAIPAGYRPEIRRSGARHRRARHHVRHRHPCSGGILQGT